jgi:NAD(P)-dependent dehydrogenase (short-subunit alcohol dehydrogenase family)
LHLARHCQSPPLVSTNLEGSIYRTQLACWRKNQVEATKGGLNAMTRSPAVANAKDDIRVNAAAPGVVETPLHKTDPKLSEKAMPIGKHFDCSGRGCCDLSIRGSARYRDMLHVDGGSHTGKW